MGKLELPNVGAIIFYKMRSHDSPVEPDRLWKERVITTSHGIPGSIPCMKVESLEEGHAGETEIVMLSQIVSIKK